MSGIVPFGFFGMRLARHEILLGRRLVTASLQLAFQYISSSWSIEDMRKAEKKGPGRPLQFNRRVLLAVDDALLSAVDSWADQTGVENRSEAIRQLVEIGLKTNSPSKPSKRRTAKSIPISKLNANNDK